MSKELNIAQKHTQMLVELTINNLQDRKRQKGVVGEGMRERQKHRSLQEEDNCRKMKRKLRGKEIREEKQTKIILPKEKKEWRKKRRRRVERPKKRALQKNYCP